MPLSSVPFVIEFPFVLGRPALLPDPWTTAPAPCVLEARRRIEAAGFVPAGFTGRVGLMLVEHDGIVRAEALLEPVRAELMTRWQDATAALVQPRVEDEDVREALLVDGKGRGTTFREVLAEVLAPFPDRDDDHGGREQRARRAVWRGFLTDGLDDPCVRLLMRRNADPARRDSSRLIALTSWWRGPSPGWDIRHDGTFCAPKSGARFLLSKLLEGIPHEPPRPQQDPAGTAEPEVLYEDDFMVVVDKPARLASVPGGSETTSAREILERTRGELFVVHRLDMGTSGVLAFAKTKEASLVRAPEAVRAARLRRRPRGPHRLRGDRRRGHPRRPQEPRGPAPAHGQNPSAACALRTPRRTRPSHRRRPLLRHPRPP